LVLPSSRDAEKRKARKSNPRLLPALRAPAAAATPIDPATTAIIVGVVKLDGEAPKAAKIDMSQDPACKARTRLKT